MWSIRISNIFKFKNRCPPYEGIFESQILFFAPFHKDGSSASDFGLSLSSLDFDSTDSSSFISASKFSSSFYGSMVKFLAAWVLAAASPELKREEKASFLFPESCYERRTIGTSSPLLFMSSRRDY